MAIQPAPAVAARPALSLPSTQSVAPPLAVAARPAGARRPAAQERPAAEARAAATGQAEPDAVQVVKEIRPTPPQEQAEQTYRQALRAAERGHATEARRMLQAALELDLTHLAARQTLVALLLENGDIAQAEAQLREGAGFHPNEPWFNKTLGQLHLKRGNHAQAAEWLSKGLPRAGADAEYWGLAAGALNKTGRTPEAISAYTEAIRLQPGHGPWWIGLGLALEHQGQRADAAAALRRAAETPLSADLRSYVELKLAALNRY